ncbi:hypothetical protein AAZX31_06G088000 [Glycine max]
MPDHQTNKHLSIVTFRRKSVCWSNDNFHREKRVLAIGERDTSSSESKVVTQLQTHIKLLLRRHVATLDVGLHSKAIHHFSKILESHCDAL